MKKITLFLALFLCMSAGIFAQQANNSKVAGNEPLLQKNEVLQTEATAFNTAYANLQASATLSRSGAVKVQQDFNNECSTYLLVLNKVLSSTTDVDTTSALNREIDMVKKLQAAN